MTIKYYLGFTTPKTKVISKGKKNAKKARNLNIQMGSLSTEIMSSPTTKSALLQGRHGSD